MKTLSIQARAANGGARQPAPQDIADFLRGENAAVLCQRVFGSGAGDDRAAGGPPAEWPVTWLLGNGVGRAAPAVSHVHAVSGAPVSRLRLEGEVVGALFEDQDIRYCLLGNLRPPDIGAPRPDQARAVLERMERALETAGMGMTDVVRTWFFLDRILDWYGDFNSVRTAFFDERNLFAGVLPASTGVGAANAAGAALVADAVAMQSKKGRLDWVGVPSPLQCPATDYRSSFSRAVEIRLPAHRLLYVSGTASITPDGRTAHVGDLEGQIALTMDVVEGILQSRGMSWASVSRGIAYFQDAGGAPCLDRYCRERGRALPPIAVSSADICRDDLLFEIEVDAIAAE
ncbi:MAG: translation initiation inhibitor [Acidobacteria bacterium]|nr:translation initiation inhibitor [Acidobacteriota bacterium]